MQATFIGCRDCEHYRGAQSISIASGTSCLQVAQKENRKRLVGDKALEKYALQFWGATARVVILATIAHATLNANTHAYVSHFTYNRNDDVKDYREAQNVMIASGTPRPRFAQKETRKHLVGDKALEKYA